MSSIICAATSAASCDIAAGEIRKKLEGAPKLVIYFAAPSYDQDELAFRMRGAFAGATVLGCSTAGELVSGAMLENSVCAMAFYDAAILRAHAAPVRNIRNRDDVRSALRELAGAFCIPPERWGSERRVAVVLTDGMCAAERMMEELSSSSDAVFIGGAAADYWKFGRTSVHCGGRAFSGGAVIALLECANPFGLLKTQSFRPTGKMLTVTRADEETRVVREFDGVPARDAYMRALGAATQREAEERFMRNPLALMLGGDPYVRGLQRFDGGDLYFYCAVPEGARLMLMEATDIVADTAADLAAKKKEMGGISGILNFHCAHRTMALKAGGAMQAYADIFRDIPTAGFSTYGEQFRTILVNQTSTMLLFK
jgi:hypothetical protein